MLPTPSAESVEPTGNSSISRKLENLLFRTIDITEGLQQVKLHHAQKKAVTKNNKQNVKMEESMPESMEYSMVHSQAKTKPILSDPYDSTNIIEMNLKRNFGGMNMDDSARPAW